MATNNPQDNLARHVTEKDISIIAKSIGSNWELLAPYLLETNCTTTVEHIKTDNATTIMRIYHLLLAWSKEASPDATLGQLFHKMLQPGTSVTIELTTIAKNLKIDEFEIKACKAGYKRPVQDTHTNQLNKKVKNQRETPTEEPMGADIGGPVYRERKIEVVEGQLSMLNLMFEANVEMERESVNEEVRMEEDGRQRSEAGNVGPCLQDRRNEKSYRRPKDTCIFDGRLIQLEKTDIDELDKSCKESIGSGAFGKVYKSTEISDGFGMQIVLKKIPFDEENTSQKRSISRAMNASRILHPFILPLLAVVERPFGRPEFWIVSPFVGKGNLYQAIKNKSTPLKELDRIKILFQLAAAIQYIHTSVPNVRNAILHKDISSKNVVLDTANNARLIDFGLVREKDNKTSYEGEGTYYDHPNCGTGEPATECWDYFSFGVTVRELLTGLGPEGFNCKWLKNMTPDEVLGKLENNIWSTQGNDSVLNDIADHCLSCDGWIVDEFKTNVVEKLKRIWVRFCSSTIPAVHDDRCHICMINPKAKETSMTQKHAANCFHKIEVCIACEKNSFLNPITCYCGTKLSPLGSRCGALLIAGNDENRHKAQALTRDVTELKKLLMSKAPTIVGISENNIRMVTPCSQDSKEQELLLPQIRKNAKYFQEQKEVDTLLIYFSGQCAWDKGSRDVESSLFKHESVSEIITLTDFQEIFDNYFDQVDKLIIILDSSYAPKIKFRRENRNVIQINACGQDKQTHMTDKGSLFTNTLIQGLKGKAERPDCTKKCEMCKDYFDKSSDFITVYHLYEYLKNHIESPVPRLIHDSDSSNIAYFTDEQVLIQFTDMEKNKQEVQLEYLQNMEQLQRILANVFDKDRSWFSVKVKRDTYRKDKQFEDCDTLEKVMQAWVQRQPLIVQFESI